MRQREISVSCFVNDREIIQDGLDHRMKRAVIGFLAHVDAGKTTLSEAVLYTCGRIKKLGRVDRQDAFLDTHALERARGITIFSKQAVFEYGDTSFTLLDTPGHVDFSTEMERTLSVLDAAVLVVSGPDGIQAHTRTLWKLFRRYDIPTFIFVNKMDRSERSRDDIMQELGKQLSETCVDVSEPDDPELQERIALCDEDTLNSYLETGELSAHEIADLVGRRLLFPCFFGSALKCEGIECFLDGLDKYMPVDAQADDDDTSVESIGVSEERVGKSNRIFSGRVFKITHDNEGNRLTHIRVTGGSIRNRELLGEEKITGIRVYSGDDYTSVQEALPGMVVAMTGLNMTTTGQAIGDEEELSGPELVPVMTYRVVEKDRSRLLKLISMLKALEEEDPSLDVIWNEELRELQVRIMGDIQLDVLKSLLKTRYNEDVDFDRGSILYKETIAAPVLGVGHFEPLRHYAEAQLMLEPGERGSGITAESGVSTDELELNWQRLILTHVYEREHKGVLTGSVLTDVHITLVAGRSHLKHTEGGDFRQATYRAIRQGLMKAQSVLLEPYYELELEIPRDCCGRAMTDIDARCGRIRDQEETGVNDMIILHGVAPVATMQGYSKEVVSYTKGLGSIYTTFCGYMPCHDTEAVMKARGYDPMADMAHPASSVFCAHGSGFVVEWYDVDRYKHIDWDPLTGRVREDQDEAAYEARVLATPSASGGQPAWIGTEEIDSILERTFNANRRLEVRKNPYRKHHETVQHRSSGAQGMGAAGSGHKSVPTLKPDRESYLLVDGYNIIFAWPELNSLAAVNIDGARDRLNDILCDYQAVHGGNLIVVYDAYRVQGHPTEYYRYHNINMVFTREAETADRFIERFAHENARQYDVTVATSDGVEQVIIRGAGCKLMTASDLLEDTKRKRSETVERFVGHSPSIGTRLGERFAQSSDDRSGR